MGRQAGTATGFKYSSALTQWGQAWKAETLDGFLAAPTKVVPGTQMMLNVPGAQQRKDITSYLAAQ